MKLKETFITHEIGGQMHLIDASGEFNGVGKCNDTTAFILGILKNDVSADEITDALHEKYGVSNDILRADLNELLDKLRSVNALDE